MLRPFALAVVISSISPIQPIEARQQPVPQCDPAIGIWTSLGSPGGANGLIQTLHELPDGRILIGGDFTRYGETSVRGLAVFDPVTALAESFAGDVNGSVRSIASLGNGQFAIAGRFTSAGGTPARNVAIWNGLSWQPLGAGSIDALARVHTLPNGELITSPAAGPTAPESDGYEIRRWNGQQWTSLGGPFVGGVPRAFVTSDSQILMSRTLVGHGVADGAIYQWTGEDWVPMPVDAAAGALPVDGVLDVADGRPRGGRLWALTRTALFSLMSDGVWRRVTDIANPSLDTNARIHVDLAGNAIVRSSNTLWRYTGTSQTMIAERLLLGGTSEIVADREGATLAVEYLDVPNWAPMRISPTGTVTRWLQRTVRLSQPESHRRAPGGAVLTVGSATRVPGFAGGGNVLFDERARTWTPLPGSGQFLGSIRWVPSLDAFVGVSSLTSYLKGDLNSPEWTPVPIPSGLDSGSIAPSVLRDGRMIRVDHNRSTRFGEAVRIFNPQTSNWEVLANDGPLLATPFLDSSRTSAVASDASGNIYFAGRYFLQGSLEEFQLVKRTSTGQWVMGPSLGQFVGIPSLAVGRGERVYFYPRATVGVAVYAVRRWDSVANTVETLTQGVLGPISGNLVPVATDNGQIYGRGSYWYVGQPRVVDYLAVFDERTDRWVPLNSGLTTGAVAATPLGSGELFVTGSFLSIAGQPAGGAAIFRPQCPCTSSDVAGSLQTPGADGQLTADDLIVFVSQFLAGDMNADTAAVNQRDFPDGQLTADDIIVFLGRYFAGC